MITDLRLENFRGFEDHLTPLRESTVLVGANNAGKSTMVEALRLVALLTDRFRRGRGRFVRIPDWLDHPAAFDGLAPAILGMTPEGFEPSIFHQYGPPPAVITATFASGASVIAFVGPDAQVHGVAHRADGAPITRASSAKQLGLSPIAVQPQVAPLLREEPIRRPETIHRGDGTYLAPQHFRNQLWLFDEHYNEFVRIAEQSWPGLQIRDFEGDADRPEEPLQLRVRDGAFVGEVSLMGHGLQMWLQIVWFLARAPQNATVVLDEPDVYMHPDLQRRLLDLVRERFHQLLIATHSIEIIADVDPRSIVAIDRRQRESQFVTSLPGLQDVLEEIGSVQNVQLMRLMRAESFYLVEGDDVKILRILQATAMRDSHPIDLVPHAELGGRAGWGAGVPSRLPRRNAEGDRIRSFAILDRDYFPDEEIDERYAEARSWGVQLRVWMRKELENYLLVPDAISRFIYTEGGAQVTPPTSAEVAKEIDQIVEAMRESVQDAVASILHARDKKGGITKANKAAREFVRPRWRTREGRWSAAPGKEVISRLSSWSQDHFGVGFGPDQLARTLRPNEIDQEVVEVVSAISDARPLKRPFAMPG